VAFRSLFFVRQTIRRLHKAIGEIGPGREPGVLWKDATPIGEMLPKPLVYGGLGSRIDGCAKCPNANARMSLRNILLLEAAE
jgi:hypothetical protein